MKKTALTILVAGALALPASALAQSSVTITGFFKLSYEYIKLGDFSRPGKSSEDRVVDDLSRIYFRVVEDLGDGVQAIGQVEWRLNMDAGTDGTNGANWVGLKSKRLGALKLGREDLHYQQTPSTINSKGSLRAWNASIVSAAGSGGTIIAYGTRTPNLVYYESPKWNGFDVIAAYSTNPGAASEADLGSTNRRGRGFNVVPRYMTQDWGIVYSYWDAKHDNSPTHQRADRIWGFYKLMGLRVGALYDWSEIENDTTGATTSKREAWSIPLSYQRGRHNFWLEYSEARDDKQTAVNDGAKMWAVAYAYDFSRRTSLGLTYAKISNDSGALYNLWNSAALQGGSPDAALAPGEDPSIVGVTMRHAF